MVRKTVFLLPVLFCVLALSSCLPGLYTSRQPASGTVVDAVTGSPLPGVRISYQGEDTLTDEQGAFSFSKRTGMAIFHIGGEHPAWPHWGHSPLYFSKNGYISLDGFLGAVTREDGKVALEPAAVPDGITALDARIARTRVVHRLDESMLVWLTIEHSAGFGTFEELARETREIAEKVIRSKLAGASPDLAFTICQFEKDSNKWRNYIWYVQIGWTGDALGKTNWLRSDARQWLNSAAFAELSEIPSEAFATFAADRVNSRAYGPFIEKVISKERMPQTFHVYGMPGSML